MIITEQKDFEEIYNYVKDEQKIIIVGCGLCATTTKTGGKEQVAELKEKLINKGKQVIATDVIDAVCDERMDRLFVNKNKEKIQEADSIIVLSCGAGVQALRSVNDNIKLHPGLNTLFLGTEKRLGHFYQYCSMCGDCVLDLTNGICPVTRCPKSYLNGPCGGSKNGKCEANPDNDCVWELIYKLQKVKIKFIPPRDYSKQFHPKKNEGYPVKLK